MADTLATYPYVVVRLGCRLCKRSGSYRLARLAEKYGARTSLEDVMEQLAMDCPHRLEPHQRRRKYEAVCEARFVDLYDPNPLPPDLPPALMRLRVVGGRDIEE